MKERVYLCIDLKSFYASVECVERGLNPLTTNLIVADPSRSRKTICLAITPSMKALGIKNRCRVFEIPNGIDYITAPPRMQRYINYSAYIYGIYLKYAAREDIHVYSIDEAFFDVTDYLHLYEMNAKQLAQKIMEDVLLQTGITATAGIGTNLYLAKIALDIMAKHSEDNIGSLDEEAYRKELWSHKPLTDFWRIGPGTVRRLSSMGLITMKDVASAEEAMLYRMFGIDAELLIDHAWGRETVTMADIKAYRPESNSISSSQVLPRNYSFEECRLILKEMIDTLCLEMASKELATESVTLTIGYSREHKEAHAHGTAALQTPSSTYKEIALPVMKLYEKIVKPGLPIRKLTLSANRVIKQTCLQYSLFDNTSQAEKDKKLQSAALEIKNRYGKNALVRGMDLQQGATAMERNRQIGGHKSGE